MNQPVEHRTASEALYVMGAWCWLMVGIVSLVAAWGVWADLKYPLVIIPACIAALLHDRRKQQRKFNP